MSVKDDLAALCSLEARIAALTDQKDELRRRLLDHAMDTYEKEGAAPTWRAGELGTVGLTVPKPRVEVFDEDRFATHALDSYGVDAVVVVKRVRPELRDALLAVVTEANEEAGITVKARFPYLNVRLSKEAKQAANDDLAIEEAKSLTLEANSQEVA